VQNEERNLASAEIAHLLHGQKRLNAKSVFKRTFGDKKSGLNFTLGRKPQKTEKNGTGFLSNNIVRCFIFKMVDAGYVEPSY
jgi:hypothetical protein